MGGGGVRNDGYLHRNREKEEKIGERKGKKEQKVRDKKRDKRKKGKIESWINKYSLTAYPWSHELLY